MGDISFSYEAWNKKTDILLQQPGNTLGFVAINNSLDVGDMPTVRARQRDRLIRETESGVIGLIAGGLEWLRQRGLSAAEVQNKVKVYKQNNLEHSETIVLRGVQDSVQTISNPRALNISDTLVVG